MTNYNLTEPSITEAVHRLMRILRRRPLAQGAPAYSRGYRRLLRVLQDHEGVSSQELADLLEIRPGSLSELLGRMEEDGLIQRRRDARDRRVLRVFLSDDGKAGLETFKRRLSVDEPLILEILDGQERAMLIGLLNKLSEGLAQGLPNPSETEAGQEGRSR